MANYTATLRCLLSFIVSDKHPLSDVPHTDQVREGGSRRPRRCCQRLTTSQRVAAGSHGHPGQSGPHHQAGYDTIAHTNLDSLRPGGWLRPGRPGDLLRRTEIGRSPLGGEGGRLQDPRRRTLRSGAQGRAVEVRGTVSETPP